MARGPADPARHSAGRAAGAHDAPECRPLRCHERLVTLISYTLPQKWAVAFRRAGIDGISHLLRHDGRSGASGVSLFGPAGAANRADGTAEPLTPESVRAAGVVVIGPPHSASLVIID